MSEERPPRQHPSQDLPPEPGQTGRRPPLRTIFPYQVAPYEPDAQPPVTEEVNTHVITYVKGLNKLLFADAAGGKTYDPQSGGYSLDSPFLHFSQIYMTLEPGWHQETAIAERLGLKPETIARDMRVMEGVLPDDLFAYDRMEGQDIFYFGNLALGSRLPDEAEIEVLDRFKTNLLYFDHALVTKAGNRYYLPLHADLAILAARVIQALGALSGPSATAAAITTEVWDNMPVAERHLFLDLPYKAFGQARQIRPNVLRVLRQLTNRLMLTREPRRDETFNLYTDDLELAFSETRVPEGATGHANFKPILPPGTPHELIHELMGKRLSASTLEAARNLLRAIQAGKHVDNEEAIAMLDLITNREGRHAIREVFEPSEAAGSPADALKAAHQLLRLSMGYNAYTAAHTDRMVAGNKIIKAHGAVRQVGGRLPYVTKWYIGRRD